MWEASTVHIYPGLETLNGWTRYEQLAGSRYPSTKRAEIEVLSCVHGYHVHKGGWAAAVGDFDTI